MTLISTLVGLICATSAINQTQETVVSGNTKFALDLYSNIRTEPGNVFFSPYSISSAFAMTYAGAKGSTKDEIASTLHFKDGKGFHGAFSDLMSHIKSKQTDDLKIHVANRLFGQNGFKFQDDFLAIAEKKYKAPLEQLDFKSRTEQARKRINTWVEKQTKDKIKDLIPKDVLTTDTRLVLVNAIYFYGDWMFQFDSLNTRTETFYVDGSQAADTKMMTQVAHFEYMENRRLQGIRMPYKGGSFWMEVYLPKKKAGLEDLEEKLSPAELEDWGESFGRTEVRLSFPKFKMTTSFKLAEVLQEMGMVNPFTNSADFSDMTAEEPLKISEVVHKAFIDVSERGTEAAAATAVIAVLTSAVSKPPPPPKVFKADHPFLFLIRERETGSILFMGRINDPNAAP